MRILLIAVATVVGLLLIMPSLTALLGNTAASTAQDEIGLMAFESPFSVQRTADRLVSMAQERGLNVFARVNHTDGAQGVDMALRPTRVIIFGNPKVGTPFMQCNQTVGIDLPQKALIWEDADGTIRLAFNDPDHLAIRHNVIGECHEVTTTIEDALRGLGQAVVSRN